jgi:hypothetical protein
LSDAFFFLQPSSAHSADNSDNETFAFILPKPKAKHAKASARAEDGDETGGGGPPTSEYENSSDGGIPLEIQDDEDTIEQKPIKKVFQCSVTSDIYF